MLTATNTPALLDIPQTTTTIAALHIHTALAARRQILRVTVMLTHARARACMRSPHY